MLNVERELNLGGDCVKTNTEGIELIKSFESCRTTAYKDTVGVWTIGWGHTGSDVYAGKRITQEEADKLLKDDLERFEKHVASFDPTYNWNENEFSALASFAYNVGSINQLTANGSRSKAVIADKILAYDKAGGKTLPGLTRRRKAERALFLKKVSEGWTQIGEQWFFYREGTIQTEQFIKSSDYATNKKLYWVGKSGIWDEESYRWMNDNVGWWIAQIGGNWFPKNEWYKVDGKWFYFDDRGYMVTGTKTIGDKTYTFNSKGELVE